MMGGSSFDLIAQELLRHKSIMDQLEQENRELRHQLADLRAGRGFFIEIDGQRFSLPIEAITSTQDPSFAVQPAPIEPPVAVQSAVEEPSQHPMLMEQSEPSRQTRQLVMNEPELQPTAILPVQAEEEIVQPEQEPVATAPTFLEEVMIDEFTAASTSPLSIWSGPTQEPKPDVSEDEELALLRRQLIGSYLLE